MTAQDKIDQEAAKGARQWQSAALAIRDAAPKLAQRLPRYLPSGTAERYCAIALDTIAASPILRTCTPQSLVRGVLLASEYGLAIDGVLGHAYLVPYKIKGLQTAQFQIGYRGLVELMYRTGHWQSIAADVVTEQEYADTNVFDFRQGTKPFLDHKPRLSRGKPPGVSEGGTRVAVYAIAYPTSGSIPTFVVLGEADVLEHRAKSKAYQNNPAQSIWRQYPDIAWEKSALRELSKRVAMSSEEHRLLRSASVRDEQIDRGAVAVETPSGAIEVVDAEVVDEPPPGEAVDMEKGGPA